MIPFVLGLVVAFSASLPSVSYWTNNQNQSVREQIANYTPQSSLVRGIIGSSGYFTSHLRLQRYGAVNSFDYTRVVGISLETFAVPGIRAGNYSTGVFDGVFSVSLKVQMTIHNHSTYVASSSGYHPDWPEGTLGFYLDTVATYRTDLSAGAIEADSIQV